jgi:hypothetical protein
MNTRERMTARFHQLWAATDLNYADIVLALQREFPQEPLSVHDAALTAGIGQVARRIGNQLSAILEAHGQK